VSKDGWEAPIRPSSPEKSLRGQFHPVSSMKATQFFDEFPSSFRFLKNPWRIPSKHDSIFPSILRDDFLIDMAWHLG
jgi:hypothetical protein